MLLAAFPRFVVALPILFCIGLSMVLLMAATNTILQTLVEPRMLGRVMSLYTAAFTGVIPLSSLLSGWAAERIGMRLTIAFGGVVVLLTTAVLAHSLPRLRAQVIPVYIKRGILPTGGGAGGVPPAMA